MSAVPSPSVTSDDLTATDAWWRQTAPAYQREWFASGAPNEQAARRALDQMIEREKRGVAGLDAQVRAKTLDIAGFEVALALMVKRAHIAATVLARGGVGNLQAGDVADG